MKLPKGNKGLKRKLQREKAVASFEIRRALQEASKAIDAQTQELLALKRIVISERAQVIFYTDKYLSFLSHEYPAAKPVNFLDLDESLQEPYVRRAIEELTAADEIAPHDGPQTPTVAKKIILPN